MRLFDQVESKIPLGLQSRFLARIGPGADKTTDLRRAICLRYEVMMLYQAKFNCKQTIKFAKSFRNSSSNSSSMFCLFGLCIFENSKFELFMSRLVDLGTMADIIVFKSVRFQVSTRIRYVCVSICVQRFQQRFQIDAFSVNTLSVFERISVDGRPKRIEMYAFSNENAPVWTLP